MGFKISMMIKKLESQLGDMESGAEDAVVEITDLKNQVHDNSQTIQNLTK